MFLIHPEACSGHRNERLSRKFTGHCPVGERPTRCAGSEHKGRSVYHGLRFITPLHRSLRSLADEAERSGEEARVSG